MVTREGTILVEKKGEFWSCSPVMITVEGGRLVQGRNCREPYNAHGINHLLSKMSKIQTETAKKSVVSCCVIVNY